MANNRALQLRALNVIRDRFCNTFVTPGDFAISFWTVTRHKNALLLDLDPTKAEENQMSVRPLEFDLYPGVSQRVSAMGCAEPSQALFCIKPISPLMSDNSSIAHLL